MTGIDATSIPAEIKAEPRWVGWRTEVRKDKPTKVPYVASSAERKAKATDPDTWRPFDMARAQYQSQRYEGVGFMLGDGWSGVDLDGCVDAGTGTVQPWAAQIVTALDSYTEYSPSGRGIHILVRGRLPMGGRKKGPIEMYDKSRFLTITGHRVPDTPPTIEERTGELERLWKDVFGSAAPGAQPVADAEASDARPDDEVLRRALSAKADGDRFTALWHGEWEELYRSHSEADLALCARLAFWSGGHKEQVDRLFRRSGLMRDKWDERRGEQTYGERTVSKAVENRAGDAATSAAGDDAPEALDRTDLGNAVLFAATNPDLRFDHRRNQWMIFREGHHWAPDTTGAVYDRAEAVIRQRLRNAADCPDADKSRAQASWAVRSADAQHIKAMLHLAKHQPALRDDGAHWDPTPMLLGVANGIVNLHTGEFRAGRAEDRITKRTASQFDATSQAPRFLQFIAEVFNNDAEVISYVQRALGYSITADCSEQVLFVAYGTGANGKTTLFNVVRHALGDYARNLPFSTLERKHGSDIPNDVAMLPGLRFVTASETNEGTRLNEARVKALTGGDPITARFMRGEWFEFTPVMKIWLGVNHKPVVRDSSHGFWRRIHLVPFTRRFPVNKALAAELAKERDGVLSWLIAGALLWQQQGLSAPKSVLIATEEYREESDLVGQFLVEACVEEEGFTVGASQLYKAFNGWCDRQGVRVNSADRLSNKAFGSRVSERYSKSHTRDGTVYRGVGLRAVPTTLDDPDGPRSEMVSTMVHASLSPEDIAALVGRHEAVTSLTGADR